MARRYISICDVHEIQHDEQVEIEGDELYGFGGKWYSFGICADDAKELSAAEFRELVIEHGVELKNGELPPGMAVKKPGKKAGKQAHTQQASQHPTLPGTDDDTDLDDCLWCGWKGTPGAMAMHAKVKHGFSTLMEALGDTCPLCGKGPFTLLGRHAMSHKAGSSPRLFAMAAKMGDPFGIVALRKKAA